MSLSEIVLDFSQIGKPFYPLDLKQAEARDMDGNVLCVAGPGAGKTEVLTQRAQRLVDAGRKPLCLTFTRHAKEVMVQRVPNIEVRTVHSFCWGSVGWSGSYSQMLVDYKRLPMKEAFTDILVDEGQDLSQAQLDAILSTPHENLFMVLDPYQSIYIGDWAGKEENSELKSSQLRALGRQVVGKVKLAHPSIKEIALTNNYRSNEEVVSTLEKIYSRGLVALGPKDLGTIGVFARTNSQLKAASNELNEFGIPHYLRQGGEDNTPKITQFGLSPAIHLMVLHSNKGKQFDTSVILDWRDNPSNGEEELNLLYVAIARASKKAWIIGSPRVRQNGIGWNWAPSIYYPPRSTHLHNILIELNLI